MPRVVVMLSSLSNDAYEYGRGMVRGITRYANDHGAWDWEIFMIEEIPNQEISKRRYDGVIWLAEDLTTIK